MTLILTVYGISLLLVVAEVFLPGVVVGLVGLLGLGWSVWQAYATQGWMEGTALIVVAIAVVPAVFFRGMRRLSLQARIDAPAEPVHYAELLGASGTASTPLRPTGVATLRGRRVDVLTRGEPVERGEAVVVLSVEGSRVIVAKI